MNNTKIIKLQGPNYNRECIVKFVNEQGVKRYYLNALNRLILAYEPATEKLYKFTKDKFAHLERMSIYKFLKRFNFEPELETFELFNFEYLPLTVSEHMHIRELINNNYTAPVDLESIEDITEMPCLYTDDEREQFENLIDQFLEIFNYNFNFKEFVEISNVFRKIENGSDVNISNREHSIDEYYDHFTDIICNSIRFTAFAVDSVYENDEAVICQGCGCEIDEDHIHEHEIFGKLCSNCEFHSIKCEHYTAIVPTAYGLADKMYNEGCLTLGFEIETNCDVDNFGIVSSSLTTYSNLIAGYCLDGSLEDRGFEIVSNYFTVSELESNEFKEEIERLFEELHAGGYNLPGWSSGPAGMHVHVNRDNPYLRWYDNETLYNAFVEVYDYLLPHDLTRWHSLHSHWFKEINRRTNHVNLTNLETIEFRHFHAPRTADEFYFNVGVVLVVLRAVNIYLEQGKSALMSAFNPGSVEYIPLAPGVHSTRQDEE